jgi:hypothetical protein
MLLNIDARTPLFDKDVVQDLMIIVGVIGSLVPQEMVFLSRKLMFLSLLGFDKSN